MIIRILFSLHLIVSSSLTLEETTSIKLKNQFIDGLFPNYNLCQIYPPVSFSGDGRFFTGAKPNAYVDQHIRFIVLHKCRRSSKQESTYEPYLNSAYECEDTKFVQVLQTCHEEVAFIWSKGGYEDNFPAGYGLDLTNSYLMMMIIYEGLDGAIASDNSGLVLSYDEQNQLAPVKRLLLGHQASGKHVLLSNQRDWISDGYCSGHCTKDYIVDTTNSPPSPVAVLGFEIHTRSLGTVAHIDVQYQDGQKFDTPLLAPTSFSSTNNIKRNVGNPSDAYQLFPGDDIIVRCHHSTLGQDLPLFGGVASYDELCFAILTHSCPVHQYCPHNTMTSCMSRPTDENLAKALGFSLSYYETQYYEEVGPSPNKSQSIRFVDNQSPIKSRKDPASTTIAKRLKRQTSQKKIGDKDLFLSAPTTNGNTVLSAIDDFDKKASVTQKTSANFAILKGYHVSVCSDHYGTFSSALVKKPDVERKLANAEIRPQNLKYHNTYNHVPPRLEASHFFCIMIFISFNFLVK